MRPLSALQRRQMRQRCTCTDCGEVFVGRDVRRVRDREARRRADRLPLLAVGLGLALAAAGLAPGVGALTVAVACAEFFVAPALTTAYLLADEVAPPERRTQAGAWVNTAVDAGISGGTAVAGLLAARLPLEVCFALAGSVTLLAALACSVRKPTNRGSAGRPLRATAG